MESRRMPRDAITDRPKLADNAVSNQQLELRDEKIGRFRVPMSANLRVLSLGGVLIRLRHHHLLDQVFLKFDQALM